LGVLIEEGRPLRMHDIADHPRSSGFPPHHPPMKTFLGVPIVVRGRVFGRLYLTEKHPEGDFTKDDERIALTLASQAGIAIENSRLYEQVRLRSSELARRVAELSTVERVGALLTSESELSDVLEVAAEEASKLTGASRSVVTLLDVTSDELVVQAADGVEPEEVLGRRLSAGKHHSVLERRKAEIVEDLLTDPEVNVQAHTALGNPRRGAFVPMLIHDRAVGTVAVYDRRDGGSFDTDDLVILQMMANQVAIAIENDRLTQQLQALAVLEERERISKELHDGVIQSIYSVGLSLQGTASLLDRSPDLARERIDGVIAQLDTVVRDVRSYIFELQPKVVEGRSFGDAVAELARDLEVNTLATVYLDMPDGVCDDLNQHQRSNLIQMVREVLSNIARHAEAQEVSISCARDGSYLELVIEDDGKGFDVSTVSRGHGLRNMEERARKLGGSVEIAARSPRGSTHRFEIPLDG
jgi:signal transduction histidine kinase